MICQEFARSTHPALALPVHCRSRHFDRTNWFRRSYRHLSYFSCISTLFLPGPGRPIKSTWHNNRCLAAVNRFCCKRTQKQGQVSDLPYLCIKKKSAKSSTCKKLPVQNTSQLVYTERGMMTYVVYWRRSGFEEYGFNLNMCTKVHTETRWARVFSEE